MLLGLIYIFLKESPSNFCSRLYANVIENSFGRSWKARGRSDVILLLAATKNSVWKGILKGKVSSCCLSQSTIMLLLKHKHFSGQLIVFPNIRARILSIWLSFTWFIVKGECDDWCSLNSYKSSILLCINCIVAVLFFWDDDSSDL